MQSHPQKEHMALKGNVHSRLYGLPYSLDPTPNILNPGIAKIASMHLGKLITVPGTVVRTGAVKMFEAQKIFQCTKCKHQ